MQSLQTVSVLAAELEGFGLVSFGMTEAEAWEAVGGEGKWEKISPTYRGLSYDYSVEDGEADWTVFNVFHADRSVAGHATYKSYHVSNEDCSMRGARVAEKIETGYGVSPFVRKGTPFNDLSDIGGVGAYRILHLYNFTFDKGAYIWELATAANQQFCQLDIFFADKVAEPIPF